MLVVALDWRYSPRMDTVPGTQSPEEKRRRLAREAEMIAEARADVAAGRTVSLEAVTAWVDSWYTDYELPPPHSGR